MQFLDFGMVRLAVWPWRVMSQVKLTRENPGRQWFRRGIHLTWQTRGFNGSVTFCNPSEWCTFYCIHKSILSLVRCCSVASKKVTILASTKNVTATSRPSCLQRFWGKSFRGALIRLTLAASIAGTDVSKKWIESFFADLSTSKKNKWSENSNPRSVRGKKKTTWHGQSLGLRNPCKWGVAA